MSTPINAIGPDNVLRSLHAFSGLKTSEGRDGSVVDILFSYHAANLERNGDGAAIVEVEQEGEEGNSVHGNKKRMKSELRPMCCRVGNALVKMGVKKVGLFQFSVRMKKAFVYFTFG